MEKITTKNNIEESLEGYELNKLIEGVPQKGLPEGFLQERRAYQLMNPKMTTTDEQFQKIQDNCSKLDVKKKEDFEKFIEEVAKIEVDSTQEDEEGLPDIKIIRSNFEGTIWFFVDKAYNNIWVYDTTKNEKCRDL